MKQELIALTVILILVGALLAFLEFTGKVEHKLTVGDFLVNILLFLFSFIFVEVIKILFRKT